MSTEAIRESILSMYDRIVEYNSEYELRKYTALNGIQKQQILSIALENTFLEDDIGTSKISFLENLFSIIHANGLTDVTPEDAVRMYQIYNNAYRYYPQFEENCSYAKQIRILHEAYVIGRGHGIHDIYVYAKETFSVLSKEGVIDKVWFFNEYSKEYNLLNKVYEKRITRRNPDYPTEVWEYNALIYVIYQYGTKSGESIKTAIHVSDLWNLLSVQY